MKRFSPRAILFTLLAVILPTAAFAQTADEADPNAAIEKMNAYVSLLNRTIRASESLDRYDSWVDMKKDQPVRSAMSTAFTRFMMCAAKLKQLKKPPRQIQNFPRLMKRW